MINKNYQKLQGSYLFSETAKRTAAFAQAHPDRSLIRLGIGDVTLPLVPAVQEAMHRAVDEMGKAETFRGYAPEQGYEFLREVIAEKDYRDRGCQIDGDEIFISDGAKCDCGNTQELFSQEVRIAVCDPVYPVYLDTNVMAGRTGDFCRESGRYGDVTYMPCTLENGFLPEIPEKMPELVYLCFPNNPTGSAIRKEELQKWVDAANKSGSVLLYDAAYEAYITEDGIPHSIYECDGARTCAIEFRSFSKNAGFTGVRLGFTVVPSELVRDGVSLRDLWFRRQGTKYNGTPYIVQRAGQAVYAPDGQKQIREQIGYYMKNAAVIREGLLSCGYQASGGVNSPYIWLKTPNGMTSWQFFDLLLEQAGVIGTPGSGFGPSGEGYFRLTAFGSHESTQEAVERIRRM